MYTLKNWYFEKNKEQYRVWGNVYNHRHFTQGQWISTSSITKIEISDEAFILHSEHSQYYVSFSEHQNRDARILKKAMHDFLWPEDEGICQRIQYACHHSKTDLPRLDSCHICALFVFRDGFQELRLKQRGKWKTITAYDVHAGMFHDEIEVSDPRLDYCYRFFAYEKNGYQFDEWQGKFSTVFLLNEGDENIDVSTVFGDFQILPKECELLNPLNSKARIVDGHHRDAYGQTTVVNHESLKIK